MSGPNVDFAARLEQRLGFLLRDPGNPNLLAECADLSLQLGKLDEAAGHVAAGLEARPADRYFLARRASIAMARGDFPSAIEILQDLTRESHASPALRYNLAHALAYAGRYAEAEPLLRALEGVEETPGATGLLLRVLHHLGKLVDAIAVGERHMQRHPQDATIAGLLSCLYHDSNNGEAASAWATRSLGIDPANPEALITAGALALEQEDSEEAARRFGEALSGNPCSGRSWLGMGLTRLLSLDVSAAGQDLAKAVQYLPGHVGTWHALAWCQLMQKDLPGAKASLERAMELDRNFGETHGTLALIALMEGRLDEARQGAARAIRLQPKSFAGRFVQALLLQRSGAQINTALVVDRMLSSHQVPGGGNLKDMLSRIVLKTPRNSGQLPVSR